MERRARRSRFRSDVYAVRRAKHPDGCDGSRCAAPPLPERLSKGDVRASARVAAPRLRGPRKVRGLSRIAHHEASQAVTKFTEKDRPARRAEPPIRDRIGEEVGVARKAE